VMDDGRWLTKGLDGSVLRSDKSAPGSNRKESQGTDEPRRIFPLREKWLPKFAGNLK
jgi:hypothetical protein